MTVASRKHLLLVTAFALVVPANTHAESPSAQFQGDVSKRLVVRGGKATFDFDPVTLKELSVRFDPRGQIKEYSQAARPSFPILPSSSFEVEADNPASGLFLRGILRTTGAFLIDGAGRRIVIGNLEIEARSRTHLVVRSMLHEGDSPVEVFELESYAVELLDDARLLRIVGVLSMSRAWNDLLMHRDAEGTRLGSLLIEAELGPAAVTSSENPLLTEASTLDRSDSVEVGVPDVIVADLQSVRRYGAVGRITAFSIGTNACNIGSARASWLSYTNNHPVIVQNLYRLKDEKFEQIGLSWVKHGFYAVSDSLCSTCNDPVEGGQQLGVGCSDPYNAMLNASQSNVSPTSHVNAHTGYFDYPWYPPPAQNPIERRLQVHNVDLDPMFNQDALYFMQGHYVMADDAAAGTHNNNASYRQVLAENPSDGVYELTINPIWSTQRGQPAVRAWQDIDPAVLETDIQIPNEGLFILAAKAVEKQPGLWLYSYALQNLNSDLSGRSFSVPIPAHALIGDVGFHDVDYHSGEPYDLTDWKVEIAEDSITWSTDTFDVNENANALRFGTVYSFHFTSDVQPVSTTVTLGLFKPDPIDAVSADSIGPKLLLIDCNDTNTSDACDIDCGALQCSPDDDCGVSMDCNLDGIPDECEPDCNDNGVADECDIRDCPFEELSCDDCNHNGVPDGCEPDCDGDGRPDDCGIPVDTDDDGVFDCYDLCPLTTAPYKCKCDALIRCCWSTGCIDFYPYSICLVDGGIPSCIERPCKDGCLQGDWDKDGHVDLDDLYIIQTCFSGDVGEPGYVAPSPDCLATLDTDNDDDIDLDDFALFLNLMDGN